MKQNTINIFVTIYLCAYIKKVFVTIYQCCKIFYSVLQNSFTSYKNDGNVLYQLYKKALQKKISRVKKTKTMINACMKLCRF